MIKIELYEFIECHAEDLTGCYLFVRGEPVGAQTARERDLAAC